MRSFLSAPSVVLAIALATGVLIAGANPSAAQSACKGKKCDRYNTPPPIYHSNSAVLWPGGGPVYANPGYSHQRYHQPVHGGGYVSSNPPVIHERRRHRTHRKTHRRHRGHHRRHHRGYETEYLPSYPGRTQYCRETIEKRGHGWHKKKVRVRRCVLVRNDLLGRYQSDW